MKKTIGLIKGLIGWAILLSTLVAGSSFAQTTDVYFVGNSYTSTYDIPSVFKALAISGGHPANTATDIIGGSELAQHWATGIATNAIVAKPYHYVVLQEVSDMAYTPAQQTNFDIYAHLFDTAITNSGAKTVLYMTWVRESFISALTNGVAIYRDMARQLGCEVSPTGEAWRRVMEQNPGLDLFGPDRHHPNQKGAYLSACNFYGTIFNESPEGLSMRTVGGLALDPAEAAFMQRIAWDAVNFVSYTNPPVISSMTVDQAVRTNSTPFTFQVSASDNGSITDYLWDFGDGITTNGPTLTNVVHDYATDGVFPVTVKVTDNSGETERTGLYVTRDTTGPQVSDIAVTRTMLTVRFNHDMQQAGVETATNYTISGGGAVSVISATQSASNTVRLVVSELAPGITYTLTLNNLYNVLGMKIYPNTTKDFTYVDGSNMHLRFDFGNTNYPTAGNWNNVPYFGGDLVISNAIDIYGVPRNIGLRFTPTVTISYAAVSTGPIASNLYPATAQRDCVYSTRKFSYQIEGADPAAEYRLTFFAAKSAASRETLFTAGGSNAVLDCAYNSNRVAVIEGVKSDAGGNIVFTVNTNDVNSSGLCYLSVLELQDTTPPVLKNIETSVGALDIIEGTTSNIQVRLSSQPASNVTVSVNASGYAHVQVLSESAFVYFATTNWNVWQPVYVEALNDADTSNGTATIEFADSGSTYTSTNVYATQIDTTIPADMVGFSATPTSGWAPLTVSFTDFSTIVGITNRFWDFGDGTTTNTTATNLTHTYTAAGTNTVQLIVSSPAGLSTNTQAGLISVSLLAAPVANFSATPTSGMAPMAVTFTDTSTGTITNRFWSFGDGVTTNTTATSIVHTYTVAGTNTVQLIVTGPGGESTNTQAGAVTVTLPVAPVAGFSATPTSGTAPLAVTFTDTSTGTITNRFWNFGDGGTTNTTATSVSHTYTVAGTNTVQLIARGPAGADTNTQANLISVAAPAPSGAQLVQLNLSSSFDYDAFTTSAEINAASNNLKTVTSQIGDHGITYTSTRSTGGSACYLVAPERTQFKGIADDGIMTGAGGRTYLLANGLTTKWGVADGLTKVNNAVGRPYYSGDTNLTRTATITLAAGDQKKYSDFNILVSGTRYGTRTARTMGAMLEVQYVDDATWYNVWSESVDITSGAVGGVFGGSLVPSDANTKASSAWTAVTATTDGYAKKGSGTWTIAGIGTAIMWEMTTPVALNTNKVLQSFRMTTTTQEAARQNDFILYAASATSAESSPEPDPKYIEASTNALDITEGTTNSFQVRLSSQPASDVTVNISRASGDTNIQVVSSSAVFTSANWSDWQAVALESLVDADTNNGTATIQIADAGGAYTSTNVLATQLDSFAARDVSQFGITWKLVGGGQIGQYANGDNWVVGPVTVIQISPASTNNGGWINNGSQLNPVVSGTQGYDNRMAYMAYDEAKNAARPAGNDLSAGNPLVISSGSLVSTISQSTISNRPQVQAAAILTVVSSAPAAGSFRPPPVGSDKTSYWNKADLDYSILKSLVPPAGAPVLSTVAAHFERPWIEQNGEWTARYIHPVDNQPDYGREIAHALAEGLLSLHMNYSNAQKETLYIRLVQYGIDVYGAAKGGSVWRDLGGHNQGRKMPMIMAGLALNDSNILAYADASQHFIFQEDMQTWYVRQYDVGRVLYTGDGRPREQYIQTDVGIPEWGEQHTSQEQRDGRNWDAYYRDNVYSGSMGHALAAHLTSGTVMLWNWPAFFDYMDRAFAIEGTNASDNAMTIQSYVADMWNTYRGQCDADDDGIPDEWENQHFGGSMSANAHGMAANGVNTILEAYIAGLNPTNAQSVFAVSNQQLASQRVLQWNAVSGRVCSVYWTTNLLNGFQSLETNILWPQNSWTDTVHGAQGGGYYRIKVRMGQ
jgi:PKD repeat protein